MQDFEFEFAGFLLKHRLPMVRAACAKHQSQFLFEVKCDWAICEVRQGYNFVSKFHPLISQML